VSDTSQGDGWWVASDGKWYPPAAAQGVSYDPAPPPQMPYGGPPAAYGAPSGAPYYAPAQTSGKATAVMVLGIVSVALMCGYGIGVIPAIVALVLAPGARREIAESGGRLQGEGQIKAGVICSWVAVGVVAVGVVLVVLFVALASLGSSSN
jgi:hypothetical protein